MIDWSKVKVPEEPNNVLARKLRRLLVECGYLIRFRNIGEDATELRVRGGDRGIVGVMCTGDAVIAWYLGDDQEFLNRFDIAYEEVSALLPAIMEEAGTSQYQHRMAAARAASADGDDEAYM